MCKSENEKVLETIKLSISTANNIIYLTSSYDTQLPNSFLSDKLNSCLYY